MGAQARDDELDRWREEISSASVPIDLVPNLREGNQPRVSALTTGSLGSLNVFEVAGSAVDVHRTRATIRRHDPGLVKVMLQLRGRGLLAQRDQKAVLAPGDFIVYDTSEPYRLHLENDYSLFFVMVPRTALKMSANGISSITAIPMRADHGVSAVVSTFLSGLRQGLSSGSLNPNPRFEEAAIDLICASATDHASQANGAPCAAILAGAKSFIDRHHADPALDTSMVAAAQHISPRYLQKLFAGFGITVAGCIKERRLERCRHDLEDPSLLRDSIGTICARHGYIDSAHFSRLFKQRYGMSPRAFREQVVRGVNTATGARFVDG
jgi:AraC-like DNA-binding protein